MSPMIQSAFWEGLWSGVFELLAIGCVAFWVNIVYQRIRARQSLRRDLIEEIDAFSYDLYKPRKLYQALLDQPTLLAEIEDPKERSVQRSLLTHQCLVELTECVGRFRAIQVKLVPLFGFNVELFGYYLAIWRYLREIRKRMERRESLYFHHESPTSSDAFYRLIDQFRYRVQVIPSIKQKPQLLSTPDDIQAEMNAKGERVYQTYFGDS
jgi:hypothetical protein